MFNPWWTLGYQTARLCLDAQQVVALRLMRLATGVAGQAEIQRMTSEKSAAWLEAQIACAGAFAGGQGDTAATKMLAVYRRRVRANRRRLSRS